MQSEPIDRCPSCGSRFFSVEQKNKHWCGQRHRVRRRGPYLRRPSSA